MVSTLLPSMVPYTLSNFPMKQRWKKFADWYVLSSLVLLITNIVWALNYKICPRHISLLFTESAGVLNYKILLGLNEPNDSLTTQAFWYGVWYMLKLEIVYLYMATRSSMEEEVEREESVQEDLQRIELGIVNKTMIKK